MTLEEMAQVIFDHDRCCDICRMNGECSGGVRGGPSGPIFPPCADGYDELWVDRVALEEVYNEIMAEVI